MDSMPPMQPGFGPRPAPPPAPPGPGPGIDPATYEVDRVHRLLKRAAYLSIYSVPDPSRPNRPIPSPTDPGRLIGVEVNEQLHRFDIARPGGRRPLNRIGEAVAGVHIRWMLMPDDFQAEPGRVPPPTPLDPTTSQRFCMLDGRLAFRDGRGSSIRAFGTGRTMPARVGDGYQLRIGAVIDVLEGFGKLGGMTGTIVVNGHIEPPDGLSLNLMVRLLDPAQRLAAHGDVAAPRSFAGAQPDSVFLALLGEPDPERATTLRLGPDGRVLGSNVRERLRLVDLAFVASGSGGFRSRASEGSLAGGLEAELSFNPLDPSPVSPISTRQGIFTLCGRDGRPVGTLRADMIEGRAFRTALPGSPAPIFRFGGFGPFQEGTGIFRDAVGMMSMNAAISVFPRTLSNLYVLRFSDPDGRFRRACLEAW